MCLPEVFDGQRPPEVPQDLQEDPGPVTPVAQLPQVRQRLLRRTDGALKLRELITCAQQQQVKQLCNVNVTVSVCFPSRHISFVILLRIFSAHTVTLTESYEELPVASALIRRQCENTRHVVSVWRLFLLKKKKI